MFGIIRPCRNRLGDELRRDWMAHLCGLCLALRDEHGQAARVVTNYDAIAISALVEAQTGAGGHRRQAGPCPLRGMRPASVAEGDGARLAASVSLLLAAAKLTDHVDDGDIDGRLRTRATRTLAARWERAGADTGTALALDTRAVVDAVAEQRARESTATSILEVTAPAETATALAFGHTAVVSGHPENADTLAEAGRLFGRLAHLLDAVEDLHTDHATGAWNPVLAFGLEPGTIRRLCDDAVLGIRLALSEATFVDDRLVHALLVHELEATVNRTFVAAGRPPPGGWPDGPPPLTKPLPPDQQPPGWGPPAEPPTDRPSRNPVALCTGWLVVCGTCQVCCAEEWTNPCTGRKHRGACRNDCACNCCDGCDGCCDCCDCCGCDC